MKIVTAEEMRKIDEKTIEEWNISGLTLMEKAGKRVVELLKEKFKGLKQKKIYIFVGKGNNGGDGLVIARLLDKQGIKAKIFLLTKKEELKGEAKVNLEKVLKRKLDIRELTSLEGFPEEIKDADIIVDALLGTGIKGKVEGFLASLINFLNGTNKSIVAVDIPSGLEANSGKILGVCIKADYTVTMGLPKRGLFLFPGARYVGELKVGDIGIPQELVKDENILVNLITEEEIDSFLPLREPEAHKGAFGHIFLMAGSVGFTGAATLAAQGVLQAGAGLVTLGIPKSLNDIMEVKLTEVMTKPLPETKAQTLSLAAYREIKNFIKKVDVVALGPGLSTHLETQELIRKIVREINLPMVIDADGINALAGHLEIWKTIQPFKYPTKIITPHSGEMARLLDVSIVEVQEDRIGIAQKIAKDYGIIVVLKGAHTVIAEPEGNVFLNPTGNPGMASGGVGDVLTGLMAGLMGQMSILEAAKAGVYIHSLAGDLAARTKGEMSLIASDLLEKIPVVLNQLCKSQK